MSTSIKKDDRHRSRGILAKFGDKASIHGVGYVLGGDGSNLDRLLWALVTLVGFLLAAALTRELLLRRERMPTLTSVETTALPIDQIEFPTITLCASGSIDITEKLSKFGKMAYSNVSDPEGEAEAVRLLQEHVKGWPDGIVLMDIISHMSPTSVGATFDMQEIEENAEAGAETPFYRTLFNSSEEVRQWREGVTGGLNTVYEKAKQLADYPENYNRILEFLFATTRRCNEFIERCEWNGEAVDCDLLFRLVPTDVGFCCAFNLDDQVLPEHLPMTKFLMGQEDSQFAGDKVTSDNAEQFNMSLVPVAGRMMGLQVILDAHSDKIFPSTLKHWFDGFVASVSPRSDGVTVINSGFLLSPGRYSEVALSATDFDTEPGFRGALPPDVRRCFFPDEHPLPTFSRYSTSRCLIDCGSDLAFGRTNCTPWNVPHPSTRICDPMRQQQFFDIHYKQGSKHPLCQECLPDCETTTYTKSVTSAPIRRCDGANIGSSVLCSLSQWDEFSPQIWADLANQELGASASSYKLSSPTRRFPPDVIFRSALDSTSALNEYDAFERDIAVARFFFATPTVPRFRRSVHITTTVFLSELGGIGGLCLGCSFISFLEVFYWLVVKLGGQKLRMQNGRGR